MKIICEECGSAYKIRDDLIIGKTSIKTQCPKCKFIQKNELEKKEEVNPFEIDNHKTIDFAQNNKENNINPNSFNGSDSEKYNSILPDIDVDKLEKEQIKEKISQKDEKGENSDISAVSNQKPNEPILYNVKKGSSFLGPFTFEELEQEIKKGKISKDFLFSKGGDDWKKVEEYRELLPLFKKIQKKNNNALKYLAVGIVLIILALISVKLLDKYTNTDHLLMPLTSSNGKKNKKNKNLLNKYIDKWKKNLILSKNNESVIYTEAIGNFYKDLGSFYIKSVNQFKEVLVKNPLKYDAFYYLVLASSFSDIDIESKTTLRDYLKILKSINDKHKHSELYYNALSAINLKLDNYVDSFNYAKESVNIVSNNAIANYLLARFYFKSEKPENTIKYLKIAINSDDRLIIAKKLLANTFIKAERFKEAVSYYEKLDTVFSKYILSKIYLKLGYYDKAYNILKKLSKNPKNKYEEFNILYAKILYQYKKNNNQALKILKKLESNALFKFSKNNKLEILNNIAVIYRIKNNYSQSIKYSNQVLQIDKTNREAKFNLTLIRIKQKKFKEAEILIKQFDTLTKTPDKYNLILKLELAMAKNKHKDAILLTRKLISLEKHNNIYYLYLAYIYSQMNSLNLIEDTIMNLNKSNPDYLMYNKYKLQSIYVKNLDITKLIKYLENKLRDKDTDKALILNNIGLLHYQTGNLKRSAFFLHKSIERQDRNPSNYLYMSYIYYHQKKYNSVIEYAEKGIKRGRFEYQYLVYLKALLKQKRYKEADEIIKKAEYNFKYSNLIKLMQALVYLEKGNDTLFNKIISEIKDDFKYDLAFRKMLYSQTY